eukprot:1160111-Pelagomonas_calceolata.AAC.9
MSVRMYVMPHPQLPDCGKAPALVCAYVVCRQDHPAAPHFEEQPGAACCRHCQISADVSEFKLACVPAAGQRQQAREVGGEAGHAEQRLHLLHTTRGPCGTGALVQASVRTKRSEHPYSKKRAIAGCQCNSILPSLSLIQRDRRKALYTTSSSA